MINEYSIPEYLSGQTDTFSKFNSARYYNNNILDKRFYPYGIDTWADKPFYGLKDNNNVAVYPKQGAMKKYTNDNGIVHYNLVFVVDAFQDLRAYHKELLKTEKFDKRSNVFINLGCKKSTAELDDAYLPYVQKMYDIFKTSLTASELNNIKNIDNFMAHVLKFLRLSLNYIPINRSTFIGNRLCPQELNGITIYIDTNANWSDIESKVKSYINDPNFNTYVDSARRYGFMVDRNIPWRIIADLESPVMQDYYKKYSIKNTNDIFGSLYHRAQESDIEVLKNVLLSFWNTFASENSLNVKNDLAGRCDKLFSHVTTNSQINFQTFTGHFKQEWFIRFYLYTKILEDKIDITQNKFESIYHQALKLNKYASENASINYINSQLTQIQSRNTVKKEDLTDIDLVVKLLDQQKQELPAEGINF